MNAIIRYYGDTKDVILPLNYLNFTKSLSEMLQNSDENLSNVSIFYIKNKNKYFVKSSNDYSQLLEKLKNEEVSVIDIEIKIGDNKSKTNHEKKKNNDKNDEKDSLSGKGSNTDILFNNQNKEKDKSKNNNNAEIYNQESNEIENEIKSESQNIISSYNSLENKDINYNENCEICKSKIIETLFKCLECQNYFCEDCETKKGHKHPLLKIKTFEDYMKYKTIIFNNSQKHYLKEKIFVDHLKSQNMNSGKSNNLIDSNFKKNNDIQNNIHETRKDKDNNSYIELQKKERVVSDYKIELHKKLDDLIEEAKNNYDTKNFDDETLGNAIKNAKGNIDDAICNLFK